MRNALCCQRAQSPPDNFRAGRDTTGGDGRSGPLPLRHRQILLSEPRWSNRWNHNRRDLLYGIWSSILKRKAHMPRAGLTWFGHKTPRHDRYWKFYRDFLGDGDMSPKYVFCMRNFVDHYLSVNAMNEAHTIDLVAQEYRASVARYAEMKAALGDSSGCSFSMTCAKAVPTISARHCSSASESRSMIGRFPASRFRDVRIPARGPAGRDARTSGLTSASSWRRTRT